MKSCPPLSIVAEFVPLFGAAMAPLNDPVVVGDEVERLSRTAVPFPTLGLFNASVPVVAPNAPPEPIVIVPPLTTVPPQYVLAVLIVKEAVPLLVSVPLPAMEKLPVLETV